MGDNYPGFFWMGVAFELSRRSGEPWKKTVKAMLNAYISAPELDENREIHIKDLTANWYTE